MSRSSAPRQTLRGLYAITPQQEDETRLLAAASAAVAGGAAVLQLRDKSGDAARRLRLARALVALCRTGACRFIVNDDIDLARAVGADGVHLGAEDGDLAAARQRLLPGMLLGASCYASYASAQAAAQAGADYLAFGAVFASPTKPAAARAPLELLGRCRRDFALPVCAIGGINQQNAPAALAAGADLLAVISDLFSAADVRRQAEKYQQLFAAAGSNAAPAATPPAAGAAFF